ncbi:MAG: methyltransferase [Elusimicrobia bacterium]|nr:methyltransferase [Elusimicrobiota bacterium]
MKQNAFSGFNRLAEVVLAYRSSKTLLVALHYDLFTLIEQGLRTSRDLGRSLRLDPGALTLLLDAVAGLGFLVKSGERYANTPLTRDLLVSTSPRYQGNNLKYQEQIWDAWSDLKDVVKAGKPRKTLLGWIGDGRFRKNYVRAMGDVARLPAADLAGKLGLGRVRRMLDVGCGPGVYSAAFVEENPGLEAVLLDLPRTIRVTRGLLKRHPRADRFRFRPGNYLEDALGASEFDLVLISNVTHVEDAAGNAALVAKAFRALRPGGRLVIHDFVVGPDRTKPRFGSLLALHLLVFTSKGRVYTVREYADWMRRAGFGRISVKPVAPESMHPSTAIIGCKD